MGAIAKRFGATGLAAAPGTLSIFFHDNHDGTHSGFFPGMATVTERLAGRQTAGTPSLFAARLFIEYIRGLLGDSGFHSSVLDA